MRSYNRERSRTRTLLVLITVSTSRTSINNFEPTGFKVPLKQKTLAQSQRFLSLSVQSLYHL